MDGPRKKKKSLTVMQGRPQIRGLILKLLVKKPKKPNSANRKCAKVRLSDGREKYAYIPGVGHTLQEHNQVLCEGKGPSDVPHVNMRVLRGALDCSHTVQLNKKRK